MAGCLSAAPALAELYKWTDAEGVVYYTSDLASIPPTFRDTATLLSTPQARPAPAATNEPTALRVTPGAPIIAEARLNGVPLTLIVDTGADRTVIAPEVIERAGLGDQTGRPIQVVGITGVSTATLVTIPILEVAGARIGPLVASRHPRRWLERDLYGKRRRVARPRRARRVHAQRGHGIRPRHPHPAVSFALGRSPLIRAITSKTTAKS